LENIDKELLIELSRVYGSLTNRVVEKLFTPSKRYYMRVNTLLITPGELIDIFREKYGIKLYQDPFVDEAVYIIVQGPYNVPVVDKKIVVDKNAAESIVLGANVYAPGVINYDDFRKGEEVNIVAPNGKIIALAVTEKSSDELKSIKKGVIAKTIKSLYKLPPIRDLEEYRAGLFYPQSLPAMLVSKIIKPKPREIIIDCCAAPGGKTTHLIQLSRGLAKIISIDRSIQKVLKIVENIKRLRQPENIHFHVGDARYIDLYYPLLKADKAIIDPPCSALGVRPKISIDKTFKDVINNSRYQIQFIKAVSRVLKHGGLLVYSTCTITFLENEYIAKKALGYGLKTVEVQLPYANKVYYGGIIAYRFDPLTNDINGYFIVVFKKTS